MLERELYDVPVALEEFSEALKEREEDFWDEEIFADQLRMDENTGNMKITRGYKVENEHGIQHHALSQIGTKLKIPTDYLLRCPTDLRASNVNHWLNSIKHKRLFIRHDKNEIRAVLTMKYSPVSNSKIVECVKSYSNRFNHGTNNLNVRFEVSALKMSCQIFYPEQKTEHVGDISTAGLHIVNSEVGYAAAEVSGVILRMVCQNGLIVPKSICHWKKRHVSKQHKIIYDMQRNIGSILELLPSVLDQFYNTKLLNIESPEIVLSNLIKRFKLTNEQKTVIEDKYNSSNRWNSPQYTDLFSLINLFTWGGNHKNLKLNAREELQRIGGKLLTYNKSDFARLARLESA